MTDKDVTAEDWQYKKVSVFEDELSLIKDINIREFTKLCIMLAPDYFFTSCPASSSGKYHPIDELSWDGTMIHTKKVCKMGVELIRAFECLDSHDEVLSACIIHDLRKQGLTNTGRTVSEHPDLAARLVDEVQENTMLLTDKSFAIIRGCVGHHYGPWSKGKWKKDIVNFTKEELSVFIADYVVSRRFVKIV